MAGVISSGTRCTQSRVDELHQVVRRHEGLTNDDSSHVGVASRELRRANLAAIFEQYVDGQALLIGKKVVDRYVVFRDSTLRKAQSDFDKHDYPQINQWLGCLLNNNPPTP